MKSSKTTRALIEGAMLIALATVLSIFKIVEMPYGGSVTIASMLPIIVFAYRHGVLWGIGGGIVYAAAQQLLGLKDLMWFTTWQSVVAVILLDYLLAFAVLGLGGIFRGKIASQRLALTLGAVMVSVIRFICHVISGCTVWVGLSIPDSAAFIYSLGYNATYMIPETIVLASVAYYLGSIIDFSRAVPTRVSMPEDKKGERAVLLGGVSFLLGIVIDTWLIAPCLQNAENGSFMISGLSEVNWVAVALVTVLSVGLGIALFLTAGKNKNAENEEQV